MCLKFIKVGLYSRAGKGEGVYTGVFIFGMLIGFYIWGRKFGEGKACIRGRICYILRCIQFNKVYIKFNLILNSVIYVLHIIIVLPHSVDGMVLQDGTLSHLDLLIQESMRYNHQNYIKSTEKGITPSGLQIKKKPAFLPVSEYFESRMRFSMTQKRIL